MGDLFFRMHDGARKNARMMVFCALLIGLFLLLGIDEKLAVDLSSGKWQSLTVRLFLVGLAGILIAWRIDVPADFRLRGVISHQCGFVLAVLFLTIIFYPLSSNHEYLATSVKQVAQQITKEPGSRSEKLLALIKQFPQEYEKHIDRHFQLPKVFIHLNALVKIYVLGVSPNKNIAYGKNGFFFEGWGARRVEKGITENFDNIADYMGQIPFSSDELLQWKRMLEERRYWLRERGIEYVFVLAPTKALIYPEYLPDNLQNVVKGTTRYDQLTEFLQDSASIHFIDLRPALLAAKEKRSYPLLFYKTDFHWNFYGAFIAYQAIIKRLRQLFPEYGLTSPNFSEFDMSIDKHWAHHRFMDMVGLPVFLHKNEHYITMVPKPGGRYDSAQDLPPEGISDVYPPERPLTAQDGSSMNIRLLLNPEGPIRSVMLLGDSFFEKCVYFFSADAKRVTNYRTIVNFPDQLFSYEKPDIVIQEILNMFILRPPPTNPEGFKDTYLKGKYEDNQQRTLVKLDGNMFERAPADGSSWSASLEGVAPALPGEVRVARFVSGGEAVCSPSIRLVAADDKEISIAEHDRSAGDHEVFFLLPQELVHEVSVSFSSSPDASCIPVAFEIHSDLTH